MALRRKRRIRSLRDTGEIIAWLSTVLLGGVGVSLIVSVIVLLNPPHYRPPSADVVVVIAGAADGRHELAVELIEAGVADDLVVSNPGGPRDKIGFALCQGQGISENVEVWCMKPKPVTTTGEAQTFEKLAQKEGWQTAVAVTNRPHHYRVRLNFAQCTGVSTIVASIEQINRQRVLYHVAREFGGYVKHFLTDPC